MVVLNLLLFDSWSAVDCVVFFFFQAEDGIRDLVRSRGLGDVYKRQASIRLASIRLAPARLAPLRFAMNRSALPRLAPLRFAMNLSLIHI